MLRQGDIFDRFQIEALLGEGGMARVYRVRHRTLGNRLALKVLSLRGSALSKRLLREGRIQATLSHPNIVAVSDVIEFDGTTALVMEYVDGLTLNDYLMANGALPESEALALFAQVLSGLVAAHDQGVLHRDLKPANILLTNTSHGLLAKISDFGIARYWSGDPGETAQGDLLGTPGYMAPEQVADPTAVDGRADLYSMGALFYCMVAARPPVLASGRLSDTLAAAQRGDFPPLRQLVPDLSEAVAAAITRCLAPEPADRPGDGRELALLLYGADAVGRVLTPARQVTLDQPSRGADSSPTLAPGVGSDVLENLLSQDDAADRGALQPNPTLLSTGPLALDALARGIDAQEDRGAAAGPGDAAAREASDRAAGEGADEAPAVRRARLPLLAGLGALLLVAASGLWVLGREAAVGPTEAPTTQPAPAVADPGDGAAGGEAAAVVDGVGAADAVAPAGSDSPIATAPTPAPAPVGGPTPAPPPPAAVQPNAPSTTPGAGVEPPLPVAVAAAPIAPTAAAAAAPAPAPEAAVALRETGAPPADAPTEAAPAEVVYPQLAGRYQGKWQGRPVTVQLSQRAGGKLAGSVELNQGVGVRVISLSGAVAADGAFTLSEREEGWTLSGRFAGGKLDGTLATSDMKKPGALSASRE